MNQYDLVFLFWFLSRFLQNVRVLYSDGRASKILGGQKHGMGRGRCKRVKVAPSDRGLRG